jgi:hypothetical protein
MVISVIRFNGINDDIVARNTIIEGGITELTYKKPREPANTQND